MAFEGLVKRDLSSWISKFSDSVLESYAPEEDGVYWSIILSYLLQPIRSEDFTEFERRLKNLTGDIEKSQTIMEQLRNFDCQGNMCSYLFGNHMTPVLKKFKKKINNVEFVDNNGLNLFPVSELLKCFIEVYCTESTGNKSAEVSQNFNFGPKGQPNTSDVNTDTIVIFYHPKNEFETGEKDIFGFGLLAPKRNERIDMIVDASNFLDKKCEKFSIIFEEKDLNIILKANGKEIQKKIPNCKNLLIALLEAYEKKSIDENVIPIIYMNSSILLLLKEKGYRMNPLVTGSDGYSAFGFCIKRFNPLYLKILYCYVSSNFKSFSESNRKPGNRTVINLENLKIAFERDLDIWKKNSPNQALHDLSLGKEMEKDGVGKEMEKDGVGRGTEKNGVGKEMEKDGVGKEMEKNGVGKEMEKDGVGKEMEKDEVGKRDSVAKKEIIEERYKKFFNFLKYQIKAVNMLKDKQKSVDDVVKDILGDYNLANDEDILFNIFFEFREFYEEFDIYTCILLLSRLHFLKESYSDLVEYLFFMVMSKFYFPLVKHSHAADLRQCNLCDSQIIPYFHRNNFIRKLKNKLASNSKGSEKNNDSPECIIDQNFAGFPKDDFLLGRLETSLQAAIKVKVEETKGVLTIFRALQVSGEVFATSLTENFVNRFLLSTQIPKDTERALQCIRNCISHYKANEIQSRLNLEIDIDLFQGIQDELKDIYKALEPVFSCRNFIRLAISWNNIPFSGTTHFHLENEYKDMWRKKHSDQFNSFVANILRLFGKVLKKPFPEKKDSIEFLQKITHLQKGIPALGMIFQLADSRKPEQLTNSFKELEDLINGSIDEIAEKLPNCFERYVTLMKKHLKIDVNDAICQIKCEKLTYLAENLKNYNVFKKDENSKIRSEVSNFLEPSFLARSELLNASELPKHIDEVLSKTYLSIKNKKKIKKNFSTKQKILTESGYNGIEAALGEEHETTEKLLEMMAKEEYRKALLQPSFLDNLEEPLRVKFLKLVNQKMEFLINRINWIEVILLDKNLPSLNPITDMKLEMLLFDCMNITGKRKDLENICTKMNDMFVGVNLRNVLSHGNILVDFLGQLLDPTDLRQELIDKCYELVADKKCLEALSSLWMEKKPMTKIELESLFDDWKEADVIKNCHRWESYAVLLPIK